MKESSVYILNTFFLCLLYLCSLFSKHDTKHYYKVCGK